MGHWKELRRGHSSEGDPLPRRCELFRASSLRDRTKRTWATPITLILGLSALTMYLQFSRKQLGIAREKQRQLTGMLISAGEAERSHIAMELHDDFSQRLALLALGMENAAEAVSTSPREAVRQLHELLNSASEIGADLHALSHRLHSSTLERLGLVPGIVALCKEFQAQQGIQVDFRSEDMTGGISSEAALCLFRIVQEGLRNLQKHSGTSRARVSLVRASNSIHVIVSDEGVGFDTKTLSCSPGLGIRSMEERARLLGGRFEIRSEPSRGTDVHVWVPYQPVAGLTKGRAELPTPRNLVGFELRGGHSIDRDSLRAGT
jgi:signal transduction histidine kinase